MIVHELAQSRSPPIGECGRRTRAASLPVAVISALTLLGAVLRVIVAHQSVFADELSTYWISATHSLGGVLSLMYGTGRIAHAEITPPLYFVLAWISTRLGDSPELLRLPSLIAGIATIPIVYLVGLRTVGRRAALVAAALTTLSPFMIYYSAEARAYAVMMLAVIVSTLAMLLALDTGRARWWGLYAVSVCAAFLSHYTSAFVLGVQVVWVLWFHPEARRAILIASLAAAGGVLPWVPGLINDLHSPTLKIFSALAPFTARDVASEVGRWAIGYPYVSVGSLSDLPGTVALVLLGAVVAAALIGLALAYRGGSVTGLACSHHRRLVLVAALTLATLGGEIVVSATGDHLVSVRDLAPSWPYLALGAAAAVTAAGGRPALAATALALAAFALGAVKMLASSYQRPDYQAAADYVAASARPGDVILDETGYLSPGPLTGLDVSLHRRLPVLRVATPAERDHPYGFGDPPVPLRSGVQRAVSTAHGHRVLMVAYLPGGVRWRSRFDPAHGAFPGRYRLTAERRYTGIRQLVTGIYTDTGSSK